MDLAREYYNLIECLINNSSDEDVLRETETLICDLLETIPYYEMKEFKITLANSFRI